MWRFSLWRRWGALRPTMRRVLALSVVTVVASAALLYQREVRSERPPTFSRGGPFAGGPEAPSDLSLSSPGPATATPGPGLSRSQHTLSVARQEVPLASGDPVSPQLPQTGTYTYEVVGSEQATGFGSRAYPDTMELTVHRPTGAQAPKLDSDEIVFDLFFSPNHEEREIVEYTTAGAAFTFEGGEVTFGGLPQTSEAEYTPPMLQIPFPLDFDVRRTGTSRAEDSDGDIVRTEDWTVEVLGRETIEVMGKSTDTWIVVIERKTRSGSSETVDRSRQYWFDPSRMLWVKWTEDFHGERPVGPGTFTYDTEYTASLVGYEPLS